MKMQAAFAKLLPVLIIATLACTQAPQAIAASEGHFERTLSVSGAVDLDLSTGSGDIRVSSGAAGKVEISARIKANSWFGSADEKIRQIESNPPIQQSGSTIRVGHLDSDMLHNISISYEIVVPADTRLHSHTGSGDQTITGLQGQVEVDGGSGDLKLSSLGAGVHAETGSGDVTIHDIHGDIRAKTGSGSIHASGIAGGFEGHTGSGSVELEQTTSGSVRVSTGSGDVELRGIQGSLQAETGSGSLEVDGKPSGEWNLRTSSGEVKLRVPAQSSFDLDASTSSGSVSASMPMTVQGRIERKQVHGKVGNGGVPVVVRTGSGDISID